MNKHARNERPRVVIVGAGFAGLWAAKALGNKPVEVLLIDRNNFHTFLPLLYQVAAAEIDPSQIGHPVRAILRQFDNIDFIMAEVLRVDPEAKRLYTASETLSYDYLILATGSVPHFFGIEGAQATAFPMKSMEDGINLRNHILALFERASREEDPGRRARLLTFVVIGGGPSGVEFAGALAELIQGPLARDFPALCVQEASVILLEAAPRLLGTMPAKLGRYAQERLQQMGVNVRLETPVARVTPHSVTLADGAAIATETAVWTAGVGAEGIGERSALGVARNKTIPVVPTLQLAGHPQVYAVGDLAAFEENGETLPMVAPVAMQQGEAAARNILRQIAGEALQPFSYFDKGTMAVIGRNAAVAQIGGRAFTGLLAWIIWVVVHLAQLIGFRNRLFVLVDWAWNYLTFDKMVRLILPASLPGRPGGVNEHQATQGLLSWPIAPGMEVPDNRRTKPRQRLPVQQQ